MRTKNRLGALGLSAVLLSAPASAYDLGEYGEVTAEARYRYEYVDQESKSKDAHANTVRLRLGYKTPVYHGFSAFGELETIQYIGQDNFNDGGNGRTNSPAVNDPYHTGVNRLYLNYTDPVDGHSATVGRQHIILDNQRFLGWSKFRQNETVHDAARISLKPLDGMTFDYAYSIAAYRSLGNRFVNGTYDGHMHIVHADYKLRQDIKIAGYGYSLDFDRYIAQLSSATYGARAEWRPKKELGWGITPLATVELAHQYDIGDNPRDYSELYHWLEVGGKYDGYSLSFVYEKLGGNGSGAVQTPVASVHSFNGWVDKFTTTPNNGLNDYFVWFKAPIGLPWKDQKLAFETQYHLFTADAGDQDYGREINLGLAYTPAEGHTLTAQLGRYYADDFSDDTTKVWLYYDLKF